MAQPSGPVAPPPRAGRRRGVVWLLAGLVVVLFAAGALAAVATRDRGTKVTFTPGEERSDDQGYDHDLDVLLDDIESFWRKEYPRLFRAPLEPLAGGVIAARPGVSIPRCGDDISSYDDVEGNAFYCRLTDYIAYDDAALFPDLDKRYGVVALAIVLAHEWGHAIQQRSDFDAAPVIFELQADCYAGAWLAHADSAFSSLGNDEKVNAMIAMLSFSDPVGALSNEKGAHGSAFDRVSAFTDGLRNGARTCAAYDDDRPTFQLPFRTEAEFESGGNLPFDELVTSLGELLNVSIEPATRACPVKRGEYLVWCQSAQGLVYSEEAEELASGIGDFAVGFLVLLGVAEGDGAKDPYCQVGVHSRALLEGTDGVDLSLSPGDLDEAVITLLFTSKDSFWQIVDHIDRLGNGLTGGTC